MAVNDSPLAGSFDNFTSGASHEFAAYTEKPMRH